MTERTETQEPVRVRLHRYPGIGRFALDLITGSQVAGRFVRHGLADDLRPSGARRDRERLVRALVEANARWRNPVEETLGAWLEGRSIGIVAGQQTGFAGGPLYTLSKIATALNLRQRIRMGGHDATVFFWMATEDHDLAEIDHVDLADKDGEVTRIRRAGNPANQRVVGSLPIAEDLRQGFLDRTNLGSLAWLPPHATYGEAFALLLSEVLAGEQVVLVDALEPELRRGGRELFERLVQDLPGAEAALAERTEAITQAGYAPQVTQSPDGRYSLLYAIDESGHRNAIRFDGTRWQIGRHASSKEEVEGLVRTSPENISTGALTRPLLQDTVLQPEVFIGGPAEVAYYAQVMALHERFGITPPRVALRAHVLVAPSRVLTAAARHGVSIDEMFDDADAVLARHDPETADRVTTARERAASRIRTAITELEDAATAHDPTLARLVDRSRRRILYHVDRIGTRGLRSALRADAERSRAIQRFLTTLCPDGVPQDRTVAWIGWWFKYGRKLLDEIVNVAEADSPFVTVVPL